MSRFTDIFAITKQKDKVAQKGVSQEIPVWNDIDRIRDMGLPIEWIHRSV